MSTCRSVWEREVQGPPCKASPSLKPATHEPRGALTQVSGVRPAAGAGVGGERSQVSYVHPPGSARSGLLLKGGPSLLLWQNLAWIPKASAEGRIPDSECKDFLKRTDTPSTWIQIPCLSRTLGRTRHGILTKSQPCGSRVSLRSFHIPFCQWPCISPNSVSRLWISERKRCDLEILPAEDSLTFRHFLILPPWQRDLLVKRSVASQLS
ncbi:uncharacterized protein LOC116573699 [Mustela erminea]|uniref:uncharacterized protein LOC116573699 n=1 Tax=Mustela erminea TaxID=36723 RepID=UPI0013874C05|nr:uncharacterized protein LOC116573699 [Mustela erminea]